MATNLLLDPTRLIWIGNGTTASGPAVLLAPPIEPLRDPGPAPKQEPPKQSARDQLQAKRKQSALAQLSGKWEKR